MEILGRDGAGRPVLSLDRATRDSLAQYCRNRWPLQRRAHIAKEWDLTNDEARGVMEATASASTIDKVWKHPRGGWRVAASVIGAVVGQSLEQYLDKELEAIRAEQNRLDELERAAQTRWAVLAARRQAEAGEAGPVDAADGQGPDYLGGREAVAPQVGRGARR